MECPGCGKPLLPGLFLCNICADTIPDALIERIGLAVDQGMTTEAEARIADAVQIIQGG
jgi:hypothetical protein